MSLEGTHLKIAAETWDPWVHIVPRENPEDPLISTGIMVDFVEGLSKKLLFNYTFIQPPDGAWGLALGNGSFNGMVGMVLRGEVDFALGPFSIFLDRIIVIQFSTTVYVEPFGIVVPWPQVESNPMGFINTFSWQVWLGLCLLLLFSLVVGVFSVAITKRHNFWKSENDSEKTQHDIVFSPSWFKVFSDEGVEHGPYNVIGRIHFFALCLAALIIHSAYKGILTAHLVSQKINIPVDGIEDLISYGKIPWAFPTTASFENILNEAGRKFIRIYDCYEDRELVFTKNIAFFCDMSAMKMMSHDGFSKHGKCLHYIARNKIYETALAVIFPRNSKYFPTFNKYLRNFVESGIINHSIERETINATFCNKGPGKDAISERPLTLNDMAGIFYFLSAGLGASILIFIAEIITSKISSRFEDDSAP